MTVVSSNCEYGALHQSIVHRGSPRLSLGSRASPLVAWPGGDYMLGIRRAGRSVAPSSPSGRRRVTEALYPELCARGCFLDSCSPPERAEVGIGRVRWNSPTVGENANYHCPLRWFGFGFQQQF